MPDHSRTPSAPLLPCPFCGSEAKESYGSTANIAVVECDNDDCCFSPSVGYSDPKLARAAWNTRAPRSVAETGEPPSVNMLAEAIHNARWPEDRQMSITPFRDEDSNGRDYCFRLARAAHKLIAASPAAPGDAVGATEAILAASPADAAKGWKYDTETTFQFADDARQKTGHECTPEVVEFILEKVLALGPSPSPTHSVLPADIVFLREMASFFRNRPTGGEDAAHWANVYNAENCDRIAAALAAQPAPPGNLQKVQIGPEPAQAGETDHHKNGVRRGIKLVIEKLHERSNEMNDPHAKAVLNAAAFNIGSELKALVLAKQRAGD